ncbi:hypothetical protein ACH4TE_22280 [Streptomyces sioyaensis]|uniref:hypothetical protein n=1 Tax=Streptomyces sioyaensis TaxID=67364 RepID=UPI00379AA644
MSGRPCTDAARRRRRRSVVAGALATTVLSGLALIGSPTPAHADDGQQASVDERLYQNEQDVRTAMENARQTLGERDGLPEGPRQAPDTTSPQTWFKRLTPA